MVSKLLSVKEAKDAVFIEMQSHGAFLGTETRAIFTSQKLAKLDALVSAVRREERETLICSECGFPPELKREPVFLDSNPLSFLKYEDNRCEKCGCQRDGSTIPVVAKKIREVAEHVQKRERERAVKKINAFGNEFRTFLDVRQGEYKSYDSDLSLKSSVGHIDEGLRYPLALILHRMCEKYQREILEEK